MGNRVTAGDIIVYRGAERAGMFTICAEGSSTTTASSSMSITTISSSCLCPCLKFEYIHPCTVCMQQEGTRMGNQPTQLAGCKGTLNMECSIHTIQYSLSTVREGTSRNVGPTFKMSSGGICMEVTFSSSSEDDEESLPSLSPKSLSVRKLARPSLRMKSSPCDPPKNSFGLKPPVATPTKGFSFVSAMAQHKLLLLMRSAQPSLRAEHRQSRASKRGRRGRGKHKCSSGACVRAECMAATGADV